MTRATWIALLRRAWGDADAVTRDMLRPPDERELGPELHRENYEQAARTIESMLAHPPDDAPKGPPPLVN